MFQRADGTSRFRPRGSEIYTTQDLLDAEARLLDASRAVVGPSVSPIVAADVCSRIPSGTDHRLSADQAAAVQQIVVSGRVVDVLVGAAGTGKSTAMRGLRDAWEREYGPGSVVGLAPSAAAAEVLSDVVGIATENTAKWLTEARRQPQRLAEIDQLRAELYRASPSLRTRSLLHRARTITDEVQRWSLRSGQLVIVDEASMAGTFELDALTEQARTAGAKVLMVGDWAQLSPVSAGGAFHLLAKDRDDAAQLHDVRRFRHEWERAASVDLRDGRADAADTYFEHGRVEGGDRESMLDLLYEAWRDDTSADAWGRRGRFERDAQNTAAAIPILRGPDHSAAPRARWTAVTHRTARRHGPAHPAYGLLRSGHRFLEVSAIAVRKSSVVRKPAPARRAGARSVKRWGPRTALEICEWRSTREPGLD